MKFRTEIETGESPFKIKHTDKIFTIGSCFAENIGTYFLSNRFNISNNPFGVLYNPVSLKNAFKIISEKRIFIKEDLIFDQEEWHSFFHHSDFSHHDPDDCLNRINESTKAASKFLKETDHLIITLGTAYVYKHKESGIIVSNCHKIPQKQFNKFRLSLEGVEKDILEIIEIVKNINPNIKIIFTVSPVRHLKDGAEENQLSKSTLLLAVDNIVKKYTNCSYFYSYEIMMDELRDYRFYAEDLVHPNNIAVEYIQEKFYQKYFTEECIKIIKEIEAINRAKSHRVRNPNSTKHREFVKKQIEQIKKLSEKYLHLDLSEDLKFFKSQITDK